MGIKMKKAYTKYDGYSRSGYILAVVFSALAAMCLIFALLISSLQIVCYTDWDFYREEYEKYDVLSDMPSGVTLSEEDGLLKVTKHMMMYLIGDKDTPELQVQIKTDAGMVDFFEERSYIHMTDCRELFKKALDARYICVMFAVFAFVFCRYAIFREKEPFLKSLGKGMLIGSAAFFVLAALLAIYMVTNFSTAFIQFHHIFFDNDLWLLDPATSLLINMLPEGLFFDIVKRALLIFVPGTAVIVLIALVIHLKYRAYVPKYKDK